ncbi:carotenoid 1,2-hydratase [Marinobacter sp. NP-4(2019)]|uniref:lipocalin-like domain-containing protein n=1 Tax=Marinobacter sp. NP-4(2019) TaxID=2488665 RepID=UPI000FC3DD98|nr:lipocalin-like domain-containing protein [Marinobacter sp. NP-4(2019)]AZT82384.1 carotenoid 1,2-hydratase [Marinobacter sp. NP-4(2019)]
MTQSSQSLRWAALAFTLTLTACSETPESTGFAGLAEQVDEKTFAQPAPGDRLRFPEDFGPHPRHRIEWWYLTANLTTDQGDPLGLQWTQFRQAMVARDPDGPAPEADSWPLEAAWMAHAAVSFRGQHRFAEKLARGDIGQAGAMADPFEVWHDDWHLQVADDGHWRLQVSGEGWSYDLQVAVTGEPVAHGDHGFSPKSASGEGSMYFSLVDLAIEGEVMLDGETFGVSGHGWFDREWSSQFLKAGQQGWDWFALHLESGDKLMMFRLREAGGDFLSGTWVTPEREVIPLGADAMTLEMVEQRDTAAGNVPVQWQIHIPGRQAELTVAAPPGEYWNDGLFPYWESPVSVSGSHRGEGYMELTGY